MLCKKPILCEPREATRAEKRARKHMSEGAKRQHMGKMFVILFKYAKETNDTAVMSHLSKWYEYIKINKDEEKLYPGGVMEEEFEIEKYALTDVFNERTIVGRFYNGIDDNFIIKEIQQETSYMFLGSSLVIVVSLIFLLKSIIKERLFSKKKSA